eukprot:XP_011676500.1 PREDICTED: carbohydrate sulfotransferase 11-like [Strongylocentrotus purpuratus]
MASLVKTLFLCLCVIAFVTLEITRLNLLFKDTGFRTDEMKGSVEDFMSAQSEVNRLRRELILQKCAKHPELNQGGITHNTYRHIYFSDKHKLLYCFIPKVGCSNWKRVMMILNGSKNKISEMLPNEVHEFNGMKRLAELSRTEQQQKLQTYKKFVYVRNPFGRLLSAFNNKFGDVVGFSGVAMGVRMG